MDEGPEIQKLDQAHNDIRWEALLNGQVPAVRKEIQHQYYLFVGKRKSGERWVLLLIKTLWDVAWDQWDHRNDEVHNKENLVTQAEAEQMNG
jgi:hypothetical protein